MAGGVERLRSLPSLVVDWSTVGDRYMPQLFEVLQGPTVVPVVDPLEVQSELVQGKAEPDRLGEVA